MQARALSARLCRGTWHLSFLASEVALPIPHVGWLMLPVQAEPPRPCLYFCRNPSLAWKGTQSLDLPCSLQQTHPGRSFPLQPTQGHVFLGILERANWEISAPGITETFHMQTQILIPSHVQRLGLCKQLWRGGKNNMPGRKHLIIPGDNCIKALAGRHRRGLLCLFKHSPEQPGGRRECKQDLCHPPPRRYHPKSTGGKVNSPGTLRAPGEGRLIRDAFTGCVSPSQAGRGAPTLPAAAALCHPSTLRQQKHSINVKFVAKKSLEERRAVPAAGRHLATKAKRCCQGRDRASARGLPSVAFLPGLGVSRGRPRPHGTWAVSTELPAAGDEPVLGVHQGNTGQDTPGEAPAAKR